MEFLPSDIQQYANDHTSQEPAYLAELNRETYLKVLYPRMLSGHYQGRVLSMLSKMHQPKCILEVGTYTGYSALCLAEGLAPDGKVITLEVDPELEDICNKYFQQSPFATQIEMRIGRALDLIEDLEGPFDLAFIDADKQNYVNYYEAILPKMPSGGLILADNVLWSGHVIDPDKQDKETVGLRNFSEHVAKDDRVEHVLLTMRDGLMMVRKK